MLVSRQANICCLNYVLFRDAKILVRSTLSSRSDYLANAVCHLAKIFFLAEEGEAYYEGFVCFSHEAVVKRADMIFQTAFIDCSKLLKKDY